MALLKADKLTKTYGLGKDEPPYEALRDVSLTVKKGERVAIIGKSGSGKSTLMHLLATLNRPTKGRVLINGKDTRKLSVSQINTIRNEQIGFIFQQFFLNPHQTVLENVVLPLKIGGVGKTERRERAVNMLKSVEMGDKVYNKATELSGGEKQRACIARALVTDPKIIFADEPTGNLDTETGGTVMEILRELNEKRGITLIIVTHDEDIAAMCERQLTIKDGEFTEGAS